MSSKTVIDIHTHIGYWPTLSKTTNDLIYSTKDHNISFTLVSFDGTEFRDNSSTRTRLTPQLEASKKTLKFVSENPYFGMLIWIRPHTENNFNEIDEFISKHRKVIYGLKFHPYCSHLRITDPKLIPYFEIAKKYDLPILVHTANDPYSKLKYLKKVANLNPNLIFIAAHMVLESDNLEAIKALKTIPNLYGDTAWVKPETIFLAYKNGLLNKIMFGTDNPIDGYETLNNPIYQCYLNNEQNLSKKDYKNLMYKNALRIFKIDPNKLRK